MIAHVEQKIERRSYPARGPTCSGYAHPRLVGSFEHEHIGFAYHCCVTRKTMTTATNPIEAIHTINARLSTVRMALAATFYFDKATCASRRVRRGLLELVDASFGCLATTS